jgi:hypothetical protein
VKRPNNIKTTTAILAFCCLFLWCSSLTATATAPFFSQQNTEEVSATSTKSKPKAELIIKAVTVQTAVSFFQVVFQPIFQCLFSVEWQPVTLVKVKLPAKPHFLHLALKNRVVAFVVTNAP